MKSFKSFVLIFLVLLLSNVLTMDVVEHPHDMSFWKPDCSKEDFDCWKSEFKAKVKC